MKIINLQAENVKKIRAIHITPSGHVVVISGKNGAGKSAVLDSIMYGIAGADVLPSKPIRRGAQTARITLDLGEIIVTRRFTAAGSTVVVEAASGARFRSPQHMLDELFGALTFDPLEFTRMTPAKQLEALRRLVPLEVDIDALDGQNTKDYEARTLVNRDVRTLRGQASGIQYPDDLPVEPVDITALTEALRKAGEDNAELERRRARRDQMAAEAAINRGTARGHRERAEELRRQLEDLESKADDLEAAAADTERMIKDAPPLPAPVSTVELVTALETARTTNAYLEAKTRRETLEAEAAALEARSAALTEAMEERRRRKTEAIANAKMPVPGLGFGDGEVLFDDLPLDQASTAEKIRVSVAIAMAANPKLRVLFVRDGSLLDRDSMRLLEELVESNDYQCWVEVTDDTGKLGVVIEDGTVVRQPPPPAKGKQPSLGLLQA